MNPWILAVLIILSPIWIPMGILLIGIIFYIMFVIILAIIELITSLK